MLSVMQCPCRALTRVSISQDTILYRSIYMYLLNHTDIRTVHRSADFSDHPPTLSSSFNGGHVFSCSSNEKELLHHSGTELVSEDMNYS